MTGTSYLFARSALLFSVLCLAVSCGGGGGESGSAGAALSLNTVWQQPGEGSVPGANFSNPIPDSVNTVRIALRSLDGDSSLDCCVAVRRGSPAFISRELLLVDLPAGRASVQVDGFPGTIAPADSLLRRCPTSPPDAGVDCDASENALPSFTSVPANVDLVAGQVSDPVNLEAISSPFFIDLNPAPGSVVVGPEIAISFAVVDAVENIDPEFNVQLETFNPNSEIPTEALGIQACDDNDDGLGCSQGRVLGVRGFVVSGTVFAASGGDARLSVEVSNEGNPSRSADLSYDFSIARLTTSTTQPPTTTTTTSTTTTTLTSPSTTSTSLLSPSTTTSTSTTSTNPSTTTTTIVSGPQTFVVRFSIVADVTFGALQFTTTFNPTLGAFDVGSCAAVVPGSLAGFNSPAPGTLISGLAALTGITVSGTTEIVDCLFNGSDPGIGGLVVTVDDASGTDSLPLNPTPQVTVTVEVLG